VLGDRVRRGILGTNFDDVTGGWRKVRNEGLHKLY
jgi:hypothetical protein